MNSSRVGISKTFWQSAFKSPFVPYAHALFGVCYGLITATTPATDLRPSGGCF